jgi:uncharacterized protein (DUF305 family)
LKKLASLLLAVSALSVAGCGGDDGEGAEQPPVASGQVPFDRAFIDAMVPHHQTAIEMAREAKEAGLSDSELMKIADNIIATQQVEIDQMLEWREQWFGSTEREPEAGMGHSGMDIASADDVDQAFAGSMIGHHTGAIRMAELAQERADHEELKTLAGEIIAAQQREIDIIKAYFMGAHG